MSSSNAEKLKRAIQLAEQIEGIQAELNQLIGSLDDEAGQLTSVTTTVKSPRKGRKRRKMSAEARERIAAAQRARWAKQKAG